MMQLVEKTVMRRSKQGWSEMDHLAFLSKNLYNATLYAMRQEYFRSGRTLTWQSLSKRFVRERNPDFYALPTKVSKEVLMQVGREYTAFFRLLKLKNAGRYDNPIHLPKYKDKANGRNVITFPGQTISGHRKEVKTGLYEYAVCSKSLNMKFLSRHENVIMFKIVPRPDSYEVHAIYGAEEPIIDPERKRRWTSGDIGVDNLLTVWAGPASFIVNGKPVKSINQYYNRTMAHLQSEWDQNRRKNDKLRTRRMNMMTSKRNRLVDGYLHRASRMIVNQLASIGVTDLAVGYNAGWKQDTSMGRVQNQKFVAIPFARFLTMLDYKLRMAGITLHLTEESYTSKCSYVDAEPMSRHGSYAGKRVKRGLFRTSNGSFVNADVNGAANILRKVIGMTAYTVYSIEDAAVHPARLTPCEH
jgi:putative transposase